MLKLTEGNIKNFEAIYIPHIGQCMDVGNVQRLKSVLSQFESFVSKTARQDFIETFERAKSWLRAAEEYENIHGEGSRFNRDHPLIVSINQKIAEIQSRRADTFISSTVSKTSVQALENSPA